MGTQKNSFSAHAPALKVCGLTRPQDVQLCLDLGIHLTGFVFVAGSPRAITPEAAALLPRGNALRVGVFSGHDATSIRKIMRTAALDYAQLHDAEDAAFCRAVGPERVIKVLWPQKIFSESGAERVATAKVAGCPESTAEHLARLLEKTCEPFADVCTFFLLDAGKGGGGSGATQDWYSLSRLMPPQPWLLAGGLGPDNVQEALAACTPFGLDCNSGVESSPGVKDMEKLSALADLLQNTKT